MSNHQPLNLSAFQWQQPVGAWRARGAHSAALRVGLGLPCPDKPSQEKDKEGFTLWHYWANSPRPHETFSQLLVCAGKSSANMLSTSGLHPWHYLLHRGHLQAAKAWMDKLGHPKDPGPTKEGDTFAHTSAWSGKGGVVSLFAKRGFEHIDAHDDKGMTPLIIAIHRGGIPLTEAFLMAGANPDATDLEGRSAMHHAALYGDIELVSLLEDAGGDIGAPDGSGLSARSILRARKSLSEREKDGIRTYWERRGQERLTF